MRRRCDWPGCTQKIGTNMLAINGCRCGHVYCGIHRLPEVHACTALKSLGQEARAQLEQRLVKVEAEKVAGIHG